MYVFHYGDDSESSFMCNIDYQDFDWNPSSWGRKPRFRRVQLTLQGELQSPRVCDLLMLIIFTLGLVARYYSGRGYCMD